MELNPILLTQVAIIIVATTGALTGIALGARVLWRLTGRVQPRESLPGVSADDFRRLETAVETIAIEVERISEAERFTAALLSDRIPPKESEPAGRARGPSVRSSNHHASLSLRAADRSRPTPAVAAFTSRGQLDEPGLDADD